MSVHTNFRVHFIVFFKCFLDDHRENGQQWAKAHEFVPVQMMEEGFLVLVHGKLFLDYQ